MAGAPGSNSKGFVVRRRLKDAASKAPAWGARIACESSVVGRSGHKTQNPMPSETEPQWYGPQCPVIWEEGCHDGFSNPDHQVVKPLREVTTPPAALTA
jgi:hypothetical protein